jgi:hypothetical protein
VKICIFFTKREALLLADGVTNPYFVTNDDAEAVMIDGKLHQFNFKTWDDDKFLEWAREEAHCGKHDRILMLLEEG